MNTVLHPSRHIPSDLAESIRALAAESESLGTLHPGQFDIIYRQRWFHLFVPRSFGGLEMGLPEALRLQEALAWTDGSVGWTVTLCSGAAWFIGFLGPLAATEIFSDPMACLAGSGHPSGIAEVKGSGFQVTGHWKYATGALHATIFTANCVLYENGSPLKGSDGEPLVQAMWFHRDEVRIHPDWFTTGLVATASQSFEVQGVTVPAHRCFTIEPSRAVLPGAVFRYPFLPFAETTLAVNSAGMAARFMDFCRPSEPRDRATRRLEEERVSFYKTADDSWTELLRVDSLSHQTAMRVGGASRRLAAFSLRLVDELYPFCGLEAADTRTEINRVWRDLHTGSQHTLLRDTG